MLCVELLVGVVDETVMLQPEVLRIKWRHTQIQNQKYMCNAIDSSWRQKQVSSGSKAQNTFSELVLGQSECNSVDDHFSTDFGISEFGFSGGIFKRTDEFLACDVDKSEGVPSALKSVPCLSGWLARKKSSKISFMKHFGRWRKSWFVIMMQPDSLILNRYDGDTFGTPTKAAVLDLGHMASREHALDGHDRFCFSVSTANSNARIVLAGESKAQAETWVATLNSVIAEMRAEDE